MSYRDDVDAARARHDALVRERDDVRSRLGDRDALEARARALDAAVLDARRQIDHARARASLPVLADLRVASPCSERWDAMTGDDRARFCGRCQQHVYDLSAMTTAEAEQFLAERTGRTCVRFYRRTDGTVLTADCPEGARRRRRQRLAIAGAALAVASSLGGAAARWAGKKPRPHHDVVMGSVAVDPAPVMGGIGPSGDPPVSDPPVSDPPVSDPPASDPPAR